MRLLVTLFCLLPLWLSAQETLSLYKNELGLDPVMWAINRRGPALIWKHALGPGQAANWHKRTALRLMGAYYHESLNSTFTQLPRIQGDSLFQEINTNGLKRHALLFAGLERQLSRKHWRLYYGFELGYWYWRATSDQVSQVSILSTGAIFSTKISDGETRNSGGRLGLFGGAQYFLNSRWSVGLELNLQTGLDFSRTRTRKNGQWGSDNTNTVFTVDSRQAPLVYLSWHFGAGKE